MNPTPRKHFFRSPTVYLLWSKFCGPWSPPQSSTFWRTHETAFQLNSKLQCAH